MSVALPAVTAVPVSEEGTHYIRFEAGRLTLRVRNMILDDILDEIAAQSGMTLVRHLELERRISLEFQDVPLKQALGRILRGHSYMLESGRRSGGDDRRDSAAAGTLWVLPGGKPVRHPGAGRAAVTGRDAAATAIDPDPMPVQLELRSPDPETRTDAVTDVDRLNTSAALGELGLALVDVDKSVREAAILSLAEEGSEIAAATLAVALRDKDPEIREQAVDALGEIGGKLAIDLLLQVLADKSAYVREAAMEMLEELETSRGITAGSRPGVTGYGSGL